MDQIIDFKNIEILNTSLTDTEVIKRIRLLTVFGNNGSEVIFATTDDEVYGFGQNKNGCLGLGTTEQHIPEPRLSKALSGKRLVDIVCGFEHCIGLASDGLCYAWGHNESGRLGLGTSDTQPLPKLITDLSALHIVEVAAGTAHTLALTITGQVYSWGGNNWGQLGVRHYNNRFFPNQVEVGSKVVQISCGRNHSLALTDRGQVYTWGLNESGQLGIHPNCVNRSNKEKPSSSKPHILNNLAKPNIVSKVVCGPNHSVLLTTDGCVYAFGNNLYGQVGNTQYKHRFNPIRVDNGLKFKDIVANNQINISMAISEDNKCYVWGMAERKASTDHTAGALPSGQSVFDVFTQLVKYKITFKTIVINDGNKRLNELKIQTVLNPNVIPTDVSVNRLNSLLKKNFDSSQNGSNHKTSEDIKMQNNENVVTFADPMTQTSNEETNDKKINHFNESQSFAEEEKDFDPNRLTFKDNASSSSEQIIKTLINETNDENNNHLNDCLNSSEDVNSFDTISFKSIDSDDYHSCCATPSRGRPGLKFLKHLMQSFDRQDFSDLKFIFKDNELIYCHKTILKIRNQKFWQNCCKQLAKQTGMAADLSSNQQIYVVSYPYKAFHAFLQYLYGFEPDLDKQIIDQVLRLSRIYEEPELIEMCFQFILNTEDSLNVRNVCTVFEKSIEEDLKELEKFCIEFAAKNWKNICKMEAFQAMNDSLSKRLMSQIFDGKTNV